MPGFDGTGPNGKGPMTGKGRGYCVVQIGQKGYAVDRADENNPDIFVKGYPARAEGRYRYFLKRNRNSR
jgi:hypothetical protein